MSLLKSHLSRKHGHTPEREGQLCPVCGKKCYYTADLEIHIAVQHMGMALERPPKDEGEVMCHECGKVSLGTLSDDLMPLWKKNNNQLTFVLFAKISCLFFTLRIQEVNFAIKMAKEISLISFISVFKRLF